MGLIENMGLLDFWTETIGVDAGSNEKSQISIEKLKKGNPDLTIVSGLD